MLWLRKFSKRTLSLIMVTGLLFIILELNFLEIFSILTKKLHTLELSKQSINFEIKYKDSNINICNPVKNNLQLLIIVTSEPSNGNLRLAIRETWGGFAVEKNIRVAFLLGTTSNLYLKQSLHVEQNAHGDLIIGDFIDHYDNLTLKTITMLHWTLKNCGHAKFLLKTDDDVFVNIFKLMNFISSLHTEDNFMYGLLIKNAEPSRNISSKYYLSFEKFPFRVLPNFLSGSAYLMPVHLTAKLLLHAQHRPLFRLEDVFLTGFVAAELNVKLRNSYHLFCNFRIPKIFSDIHKFISVHYVNASEQYELWRILLDVRRNYVLVV